MNYSRAQAILALAATLLVAASLFATGHGCEGAPSESIEDACHRAASPDRHMHEVCLTAMHTSSPPDSKVSTYAAIMVKEAAHYGEATANTINIMLQHRSNLTKRQWTMLSGCYGDLRRALQFLAAVVGQLHRCEFAHLRQGFTDAEVAMDHCTVKLVSIDRTSGHLQQLVIAAKSRAVLASVLGESLR